MPAHNFLDLTGQHFGRLIVEKQGPKNTDGSIQWWCLCECGNRTLVARHELRCKEGKGTRSCGCLDRDRTIERNKKRRTHGRSRTPEYARYANMRARCLNPTDQAFPLYGGRGITICERWDSFELFLEDMGPCPTSKHSIERIDNNGPYSPDNCAWATQLEQNRNRRRKLYVIYQGKYLRIHEVMEQTGLTYSQVYWRFPRIHLIAYN